MFSASRAVSRPSLGVSRVYVSGQTASQRCRKPNGSLPRSVVMPFGWLAGDATARHRRVVATAQGVAICRSEQAGTIGQAEIDEETGIDARRFGDYARESTRGSQVGRKTACGTTHLLSVGMADEKQHLAAELFRQRLHGRLSSCALSVGGSKARRSVCRRSAGEALRDIGTGGQHDGQPDDRRSPPETHHCSPNRPRSAGVSARSSLVLRKFRVVLSPFASSMRMCSTWRPPSSGYLASPVPGARPGYQRQVPGVERAFQRNGEIFGKVPGLKGADKALEQRADLREPGKSWP